MQQLALSAFYPPAPSPSPSPLSLSLTGPTASTRVPPATAAMALFGDVKVAQVRPGDSASAATGRNGGWHEEKNVLT